MENPRKTVGSVEAGRMLDVSHDTIQNYWKAGYIEGYKQSGQYRGRLRIYVDSLEAFDRQRKSAGAAKEGGEKYAAV
jgi:hypothetical protein